MASGGPFVSFRVAQYLAKFQRIPWVADYRDLWSANHYYPYYSWRRSFDAWLEKATVRSASLLVTVSDPLAKALAALFPRIPVCVVMNGYDGDDYQHDVHVSNATILTITYTGNVYPGYQDPSPLLEAASLLSVEERNHLRIRFYRGGLDHVAALANRFGVGDLVELCGEVPFKESVVCQQQADLLLLLLWHGDLEQGVYTAKLFEYFGARRPILALGAASSPVAELIVQRKAGWVFSSASALLPMLRKWIADKRCGHVLPPSPPQAAQGMSRSEQFKILEERLLRLEIRSKKARTGFKP
jgi:glycosyltransferase involved in cell wall biosynthesis